MYNVKTATGLVQMAKRAYIENWGFCLGAYGQVLTPAVLEALTSMPGHTGEYNSEHIDYLKRFLGKRVSDCYGLVKAYLWWNDGNVKYNAAQDRNQAMAFNAAKEKGVISTMPDIPGIVLCSDGHAGVYIGNGQFIENSGIPKGIGMGIVRNGVILAGSNFEYWFKDTYIKY